MGLCAFFAGPDVMASEGHIGHSKTSIQNLEAVQIHRGIAEMVTLKRYSIGED